MRGEKVVHITQEITRNLTNAPRYLCPLRQSFNKRIQIGHLATPAPHNVDSNMHTYTSVNRERLNVAVTVPLKNLTRFTSGHCTLWPKKKKLSSLQWWMPEHLPQTMIQTEFQRAPWMNEPQIFIWSTAFKVLKIHALSWCCNALSVRFGWSIWLQSASIKQMVHAPASMNISLGSSSLFKGHKEIRNITQYVTTCFFWLGKVLQISFGRCQHVLWSASCNISPQICLFFGCSCWKWAVLLADSAALYPNISR